MPAGFAAVQGVPQLFALGDAGTSATTVHLAAGATLVWDDASIDTLTPGTTAVLSAYDGSPTIDTTQTVWLVLLIKGAAPLLMQERDLLANVENVMSGATWMLYARIDGPNLESFHGGGGGSGGDALRTITASTTLDPVTDDWIIVNATAGPVTVTFPAVTTRTKPYYLIKFDAAHDATFAPDGTDTFNGKTSYVLRPQFTWATVKPDGTGRWYVMTLLPPAELGGTLYFDGTAWAVLPIS